MSSSNGNGHTQRLDSWKEIAAYLRRDERTAIRWEKDRGLPVHRVPGGKRKAVFAYPAELDAWLTREDRELVTVSGQDRTGSEPQRLMPVSPSSLDDTNEVPAEKVKFTTAGPKGQIENTRVAASLKAMP